MLIPRVKLTAVASNNGINISTGSREPSQQKGPPDPALEHLKKLSFQRLHEVCLLGSHLYIFLNESFGYETSAYSDKYQLVKKKKTDKEKDQSVKVPNDHAFQWSTHFLNGFFSLPRKAQLKMHLKRVP